MHNKKMFLIWPKGGDTFPAIGKKLLFFYPLNLPIIAALTPPTYDVQIIDEHTESIDFGAEIDLVAINVLTHNAHRAYAIARQFRERKIKVVLGGIHVSLLPSEAVEHADSIVIGQAENIWNELIEDFENHRLKQQYCGDSISSEDYVIPNRNLLRGKSLFNIPTVEATRGCPNSCHFCAVAASYKTKYVCRQVNEVVEEIRALNSKLVLFLDDNLTANKEYAKQLFSKLARLEIKWGGQVSIDTAKDQSLLRLMRDSGCSYVFVGLETISELNLKQNRKLCNLQNYETSIKSFHDYGIAIYGSFIFGLDNDDETVFERTVKFAHDNSIEVAAFSIFTPLPGTKQFAKLLAEGRIRNLDWSKYDFRHVVFQPANLTASRLQEGYHWAWRNYYSANSIRKRISNMNCKKLTWPINLAYFVQSRASYKRSTIIDKMDSMDSNEVSLMGTQIANIAGGFNHDR